MDYPLQVTVTLSASSDDMPIHAISAHTTALLYNQSDLQEWVERQLDIHSGATLLVESANMGWQRFEVILLQDGAGDQTIAGLQAYLEPTGIAKADAGWVQPPVDIDTLMVETLSETCAALLEACNFKGVAGVTVAVDPATAQVFVLDLNIGTSRNIAFADVAGSQPLFEMAAKIALGASLAEVRSKEQRVKTQSRCVAVRLPVAPPLGSDTAGGAQDMVPPPARATPWA